MSVDSTNISFMKNIQNNQTSVTKTDNSNGTTFSDELKKAESTDNTEDVKTQETEKAAETEETQNTEDEKTVSMEEDIATEETQNTEDEKTVSLEEDENIEKNEDEDVNTQDKNTEEQEQVQNALDNLGNAVDECKKINQSDEKRGYIIEEYNKYSDNKEKGEELINNNIDINENKDRLAQMALNMNFAGNNQSFSSFMNNNDNTDSNNKDNLRSSVQDLAEEAAIMSNMQENIAMANKNSGIIQKNNITDTTLATTISYDKVVMNEADVEVFTNLVQNGSVDMNNLAPEAAEKSVNVSKTLADMLAKSMQDNKPLRIDFDNDISVIIRISREGKLSADFLPSSQIAEAYLKENLPLLKQRFEENNISYDELNQRNSKEREREQNKRKDQNNE